MLFKDLLLSESLLTICEGKVGTTDGHKACRGHGGNGKNDSEGELHDCFVELRLEKEC